MMLRFSIIIPTLNRKDMLLDAIDTVRSQSWSDFEIIVIDGGSTDGTLEAIKKNKYKYLRLLHGPDCGVYDALNKGIGAASGNIVGFLNSDDAYELGAFAAVARAFREHIDADAVCGTATLIEDGRVIGVYDDVAAKMLSSPRPIFIGACIPNARFFRRETLTRVGEFSLDYCFIADRDWLARFSAAGLKTVAIPERVYRYRQHPNSLTFGGDPRRHFAIRGELLRFARQWRANPEAPDEMRRLAPLLEGRCLAWLILAALRGGEFGTAARLVAGNGRGYWPSAAGAIYLSALDIAKQRFLRVQQASRN
jgi:glycosyltransferase involved in cell wall biosynthesis